MPYQGIKEIQEQRNLSQYQPAELTAIIKSMLRQIETSRSSPAIAFRP